MNKAGWIAVAAGTAGLTKWWIDQLSGRTMYKATGERYEYESVDLDEQKVVVWITYRNRRMMRVVVDLKNKCFTKLGTLEGLPYKKWGHTSAAEHEQMHLEQLRQMAEFIIENEIHDVNTFVAEPS